MVQAKAAERPMSRSSDAVLRTDLVFCAATFLLMALLVCLAIYRLRPSEAALTSAPPEQFSAGRAMQQLQEIAQKPHPVGAVEHARVGDYIRSQLSGLGVSPEVQETTGLTNILARLKGTTQGKAVILVGHYDTVMMSPGASDDGSAVVAMLETLRALKASPPLKNDIIFLFSDGEELGSMGAKAFVYKHPWAKDVGVVLNFEARGTSGSAIMFETSDENGWLIEQFAKAAPHPVATSLSYDIYKLLPNDTDLTIFKEAGYSGLNFAYINGSQNYHTAFDNLANIDHNSLQQQGAYALALARHLGNSNLENVRATGEVYFDLFGATLISYSENWVSPLAGLVLLLFAGVMALGVRRRELTVRGVLSGFVAVLASMLGTILAVTGLWWARGGLQSHRPEGGGANADFDILIYVVTTIAVASVLYLFFFKRIKMLHLLAGGALWWLLWMLWSSLYLQGGSYLFTWPLLFSLVALAIVFVTKDGPQFSKKHLLVLALCATPGIVLVAPVIYLTCIAMTLTSISSMVVIAVLGVLLISPLLPHLKIAALNKA